MRHKRKHPKSILAMAIASLSISGAVVAQGYSIEEVVVTAQKRAQNVQDIPVSISTLSGSDIEGLNLSSGSDIAAHVPNLSVTQPYGEGTAPSFSLRGITTTDYSQNQSSPIAMYVDEVYKSVGALQSLQVFDLERIEVLRGPQGTLYGKNATGGAVNFVAKKPDFEQEGYLTLGGGNYNRKEAKGALQGDLVDDVLATRLAFTYATADGTVKNKLPGGKDQGETDQWAFRLGFLYNPTDNVDAYLRFSKSSSTGQNLGAYAGNIQPGYGLSREGLGFHENTSALDVERKMENSSAALTVNWDVSEQYTVASITSYDEGEWLSPEDDDGLSVNWDHNEYNSEVRQFTQEFRITSDYQGSFNWIGGVFWGADDVEVENALRLYNEPAAGVDAGFGDFGLNFRNQFTQERETVAAYLHTTYDLSDVLTLTVGARYTEDNTKLKDYLAFNGSTPAGQEAGFSVPSIGPGGYAGLAPNVDFTDRNASGKLGLDWVVNDDTMAYISFSQGYRSGAVNAQAFFDVAEITTVKPEELDAFEIGIKSQFFDNKMQVNGAIFHYDYTNQQYLDTGVGGIALLRNADKSQIIGAEVETTVQAAETLALRLGLGYLQGEVKKLVIGDGSVDAPFQDLSGNDLITTPELSVTASIDWGFLELESGMMSVHLDTSFSDKQQSDIKNTARVALKDYWLTNGRITFDSADDRYSISAWVKNATDEEYLTFGLDTQAYGLGFDFFTRGLPRTFGIDATLRM